MFHRPLLSFAALIIVALPARAQTPAPYHLYTGDGRAVALDEIVSGALATDVLFIGEQHDDPGAHALEADVLAAVLAADPRTPASVGRANSPAGRSVALSLEMFERDTQLPLDEYLRDLIREKDFLAAARPWKNYVSDYRPLVELAHTHHLPVIAANAPNRYVSRVGRLGVSGLATLPGAAQSLFASMPLPPASQGYLQRFEAFAAQMPAPSPLPGAPVPAAHGNAFRSMFEAQWLRDATMADSIARHLRARPRDLVIHVNGAFHSESRLGTPEALLALRPGTKFLVLTVRRDAAYPAFTRAMTATGDFVAVTAP